MAVILAGRQGWTPKADPMQLWLGLPIMLVSVCQVGLLLFIRILILDLMQLWLNLSMVLARVWGGLGVVLMLLARTVAISV